MLQYFHFLQKEFYGNPTILRRLLDKHGTAKKAWESLNKKSTGNYSEIGMKILPLSDPTYPEALRNTTVPPMSFYYKGKLDCLSKPVIAIVGSRKISPYGRKALNKIIEELSGYDITIASGLAYGVDAHAHRQSLAKDLTNVAVLAGGLDKIYPSPHIKITEQIIDQGGAIISEMPPGVPSQRFMFPIRNRIISGLSQAVIVVEAPARSGALITANYAFADNRLVYAIPGDITNYRNAGCHNLIKRQQASLLTDALQIIEDLKLSTPNLKPKTLDKSEDIILEALHEGPLHISRIATSTKLPQKQLAESLLKLELAGRIRNIGSLHYTAG